MKVLKLTATIIVILAIIACRDTPNRDQKDQLDKAYPGSTSREDSSSENNDAQNDPQGLPSNSAKSGFDREEMRTLYTYVQMNDEQIRQFEENFQNHLIEVRQGTRNARANTEMERNRILKEILSPEQYRKYEAWLEKRSQERK